MMTTATASSGASGSFYFCKSEGHCHSTFNRGPGRRHRQNGFALVHTIAVPTIFAIIRPPLAAHMRVPTMPAAKRHLAALAAARSEVQLRFGAAVRLSAVETTRELTGAQRGASATARATRATAPCAIGNRSVGGQMPVPPLAHRDHNVRRAPGAGGGPRDLS